MVPTLDKQHIVAMKDSFVDGQTLNLSTLDSLKLTEEGKRILQTNDPAVHFEIKDEEDLTSSYTNKSFYLQKVEKTKTKTTRSTVAILRRNTKGNEWLFDRKQENKLLELCNEIEIGPKVLFYYEHGICTKFIKGFPISMEFLRQPQCFCLIAKQLAKFNSLTLSIVNLKK
ncbi:MAG: hypothetical protein MHPSP_001506 [Paramarteilia canceri]